jgi:hypothetical protein
MATTPNTIKKHRRPRPQSYQPPISAAQGVEIIRLFKKVSLQLDRLITGTARKAT